MELWEKEPDEAVWTDEDTGLSCLARRGVGGCWCGYVRVPPGHPWFKKTYEELGDVEVHGGLTFADVMSEDEGAPD